MLRLFSPDGSPPRYFENFEDALAEGFEVYRAVVLGHAHCDPSGAMLEVQTRDLPKELTEKRETLIQEINDAVGRRRTRSAAMPTMDDAAAELRELDRASHAAWVTLGVATPASLVLSRPRPVAVRAPRAPRARRARQVASSHGSPARRSADDDDPSEPDVAAPPAAATPGELVDRILSRPERYAAQVGKWLRWAIGRGRGEEADLLQPFVDAGWLERHGDGIRFTLLGRSAYRDAFGPGDQEHTE